MPLLALVPASGDGEDVDFDHRFRRQRVSRLLRGVGNGMSTWALFRFRLGLTRTLRFHGVDVQAHDTRVTSRVIEDIWMRGEYDIPGFVPLPGWRVIDIGANVGIFSMLAASRGAQVISYEPHPVSFELLCRNTARWHVECHHGAVVSGPSGPIELFLHGERDTRHTVHRPGLDSAENYRSSVTVPAFPVHDVLERPCELLKIDCEGSEFEILSGAGEALRGAERIIAEVDGEVGDTGALAATVRAAGFDVTLHEAYPGMSFQLLTAVRRAS